MNSENQLILEKVIINLRVVNSKVYISEKIQKIMMFSAICYLSLPYLIFYIGTLKFLWATLFSVTLCVALAFSFNYIKQTEFDYIRNTNN